MLGYSKTLLRPSENLPKFLKEKIDGSLAEMKNSFLAEIKDFTPLEKLLQHIDCQSSLVKIIDAAKKSTLKVKASDIKEITLTTNEHMMLVFTAFTQKTMARPDAKERKDMPDPDALAEKRKTLVALFDQLGLCKERKLATKDTGPFIVQGGFGFRFIDRVMDTLLPALQTHKPETCYFPSGIRNLDPDTKENGRDLGAVIKLFPELREQILTLKTEKELIEFIIKKLLEKNKEVADAFQGVGLIFDAPAAPKPGDHRGRTDDVAVQMAEKDEIKSSPKPAVLISNFPYLPYQVETNMSKMNTSEILGVGGPAPDDTPICDYYDALTRVFFSTSMRMLQERHELKPQEAAKIINDYKKNSLYHSDSLLNKYYEQTAPQSSSSVVLAQR